jgi:hypothetical protein
VAISVDDFLKYSKENTEIQGTTDSIVIGQPSHPLQRRIFKSALVQGLGLMELLTQSSWPHTKIPIVPDAGNGNLAFLPGRADIEGIEDAFVVDGRAAISDRSCISPGCKACRERQGEGGPQHFELPEA